MSDAINKGRRQLGDYEEKLGLAGRYRALGEEAGKCMDALRGVRVEGEDQQRIREAEQALRNILRER